MNIPDEAVEAAAKAAYQSQYADPWEMSTDKDEFRDIARAALEAVVPRLVEDVERELSDAKRMVALLVLEAGGKVALSRRAITEVSNRTIIETTQDVINGGWVIRARVPNQD